MPLVHQVVGTWLKFLTISMVTLDEKVLLLWCVTYISNTFCDTNQIYMKLVNLLKQFIIINITKLSSSFLFGEGGGGWNETLASRAHKWATQTPPSSPILYAQI